MNKKLLVLLLLTFSFCIGVAYGAFSYTYDTATPAGSDDPAEADDRMREIKLAIQEIMDVEHDWTLTGTTLSGDGRHTDITCDSIVNAGALTMADSKTLTVEKLRAVDSTGIVLASDNNATVIVIEDDGTATLADGSTLAAATESGDGDRTIADKKYVDDQVDTQNMTPSTYAGEESVTFPNGLIMKTNHSTTPTGNVTSGNVAISFGTAFPTAVISVVVTLRNDTDATVGYSIDSVSTTGFTFYYKETGGTHACDGFDWIATGR